MKNYYLCIRIRAPSGKSKKSPLVTNTRLNWFPYFTHKYVTIWLSRRFTFCKGKCCFKDVTVSFCEQFKGYLTNTKGLHRRAKLSQNTASAYFNAFMSIVNLAHQDGIIKTDINTKISRIHWKHDTTKEYLDEKEIRRLERVEFKEYPDIQRACLLSIYTGLRRSDILALDWKSVHINSKKRSYLDIVISKTQVAVELPLSPSLRLNYSANLKREGWSFPTWRVIS